MPSFSQIVNNHKELKSTIFAIEQMKKKIIKNEKDMHPPEEFALRMNDIGIGSELQNNINMVIDNIEVSNISSDIVLLNTLVQGIKSTEFNPLSALQLWGYIQKKLTTYATTRYNDAIKNLSSILNNLSTNKKYTSVEMKTIESTIDIMIKEINQLTSTQISKTDIEDELNKMVPELVRQLSTLLGGSTGVPPAPGTTGVPPAPGTTGVPPAPVPVPAPALAPVPVPAPALAPPPPPPPPPPALGTTGAPPAPVPSSAASASTPAPSATEEAEKKEALEKIKTTEEKYDEIKNVRNEAINAEKQDDLNLGNIAKNKAEKLLEEIKELVERIVDINKSVNTFSTRKAQLNAENILKNATDVYDEIEEISMRIVTASLTSLTLATSPGGNFLNSFFSITKEQAQNLLSQDKFIEETTFKEAVKKLKEKRYIKQDYNGSIFNTKGRDKKVTVEWLLSIKLLGIALVKSNAFLDNINKSDLKDDEKEELFEKINLLNDKQSDFDRRAKINPIGRYFKNIIQGDSSVGNVADELFPSSGSGMKRGNGIKRGRGLASNMNQLISRTENLIKAAQMGNKTRELFNELDSNLQVLIDKKKITKRYRDDIMKKLFF